MPDDDTTDFDDNTSEMNQRSGANGRENDSRGDSETEDNESDDDLDDESGDGNENYLNYKSDKFVQLLLFFFRRHRWVKKSNAGAWSSTIVTFVIESRCINIFKSSFTSPTNGYVSC